MAIFKLGFYYKSTNILLTMIISAHYSIYLKKQITYLHSL